MKKRENGFYWVRIGTVWTVCQWEPEREGDRWWWPGWEVPCKETEFDEVDENRITRDVHRT